MRRAALGLLVLAVSGCGGRDRSADAERTCVVAAQEKAAPESSIDATRVGRQDQKYTVQGSVTRGDRQESFACFAGPPPGNDSGQVTVETVVIGNKQMPVGA